jgi:pyrroloquinoline quinone (PQQ) biosynthesis protein C
LFLIKNLWDEHGGGDPGQSHRSLYRRFVAALAKKTEEVRPTPLPSTIAYVEEMLALCGRRDVAAAVGALCFGVENYTSEQYRRTLEGLQKYAFFAEPDLEFFRVHIAHDPRHYSELLDVISFLDLVPEHIATLKDGAAEALRLELMMWDGIAESL